MTEVVKKIPDLQLANYVFLLKQKLGNESTKESLMKGIKANNMAPFYRFVCGLLGWPIDSALMSTLQQKNESTIKELDEKIEDALTNLGETEYSEALIAKARYLAEIGDKKLALEAHELAIEKTASVGHRIDLLFQVIRIGFFYQDDDLISSFIEKVQGLIEKGGDWDRRNRLKVYRGIYLISTRQFKDAVNLLIDTLSTFTSTELMEYKSFVRYVVLTASLILERPDFKQKIIDSPEILECIHEIPHISNYANSFYDCKYEKFFLALAEIEKSLKTDIYLFPHVHFYVREMRIRVYGQVLESYKSVSIKSLANSFGVTEDWIDSDLSRFISSGRLNAVIDKVAGVVLTNRPDSKNAQYQEAVKEGDVLLNSIQKLSRVINV